MGIDSGRGAEVGTVQHSRPKQAMKVNNIFANKVIQLSAGVFVKIMIKIQVVSLLT